MNLVLIGYRASGKTSVGLELSRRLNRPFVDIDESIEAEAGLTIPEIVEAKGWDYFRALERQAVADAAGGDRQIIATGGGVVLDEDNVSVLRTNGFVVWLKADLKTIETRLRSHPDQTESRPPLLGSDSVDEVAQVLKTREPFYARAAHLELNTSDLNVREAAGRILKEMPDLG